MAVSLEKYGAKRSSLLQSNFNDKKSFMTSTPEPQHRPAEKQRRIMGKMASWSNFKIVKNFVTLAPGHNKS
jgi:hypothetical protein